MLPSLVTWLKVIDHANVTSDTRTKKPKSESFIDFVLSNCSKKLHVGIRLNIWNTGPSEDSVEISMAFAATTVSCDKNLVPYSHSL